MGDDRIEFPDERRQRLHAVIDDACEKAGLEEGVIVLLDPVTNEAHISMRMAGPVLVQDAKGQILVAQKVLYALASYIEALGGYPDRSWPHRNDG